MKLSASVRSGAWSNCNEMAALEKRRGHQAPGLRKPAKRRRPWASAHGALRAGAHLGVNRIGAVVEISSAGEGDHSAEAHVLRQCESDDRTRQRFRIDPC